MNEQPSGKPIAEVLAGAHHLDCVAHLLACDEEHHDMQWLEWSLQAAVSVEFSTIPPYLAALWSIKDERDEVAASLRNVVQEEMLHMALACNMLTAIGCIPKINDPQMVPVYPGKIPGGVHPELCVSLMGLCNASLDAFTEIEAPSGVKEAGHKTIGAFYEAIACAFRKLNPPLSTERQISGPLAYMIMEDLDVVERAIALIMDQGEGSEVSPKVDHSHELAHYYRFREIREGKKLSSFDEEKMEPVFHGRDIPRPDTWPMATIPEGGYLQEEVSAEVWEMVHGFDQTFTLLLERLQHAWEFGDQGALVHAIETMFGLSDQARSLMQMKIKGKEETYGPCFRVLTPETD